MPPKEVIAKQIGSYAAQQAEAARKQLEALAHNIDIHITTRKSIEHDVRFNKFEIYVTNIQNQKNNIFSKLFGNKKDFRKIPNANDDINICNNSVDNSLSQRIVKLAEKLKDRFLKYSK